MTKIRKQIAAAGVGIAFAIGSTAGAQAPVPVRKAPPPAPSAKQAQPTPLQGQTPAGGQPGSSASARATIVLHCGVTGMSVNLFSTAGLRCTDPTPGKCSYVIWSGWGPQPPGYNWNQVDFTCAGPASTSADPHFYGGYYTGISVEPEGPLSTVTFGSADRSHVCVAKFPPSAIVGLIPQNSELIVRANLMCL